MRNKESSVMMFMLVVSVLLAVFLIPVLQASTLRGSLSSDDVLIVSDQSGKVVGVYPSGGLYVEYQYTYTYGTDETGEVSYEVYDYRWWWSNPRSGPPPSVSVPSINATLRLDCEVKMNAVAGSYSRIEDNTTVTSAAIVIGINVKIYIEFDKAPTTTGSIDLGSILSSAFGTSSPTISYIVTGAKYVDGQKTEDVTVSDDVVLSLTDLKVRILGISIYPDKVTKTGYVDSGSLDSGVVITPVYSIDVCGRVIGGDASYELVVSYADKEAILVIDSSSRPRCATIANATITPNENATIPIVVKSGAFTIYLNYTKPVDGAVITIGRATGRAVGSPGKWNFIVTIPVSVSGYLNSSRGFTVSGSVSGSTIGTIQCQSLNINLPSTYTLTCNATSTFGGSASDIVNATYTATVTLVDDLGRTHTYTGSVYMDALDPTNIADLAWEIYSIASRALFMGVIITVGLMIISLVKQSVTDFPLLDPNYLRGAMLTMVVAILIIYVAIPFTYGVYAEILSNIPLFQQYVTPPPSGDPKAVFTHLVGYYDKLFQEIESDYQTRFVANVQGIFDSVRNLIAVFLGIMIVALALSFFAGAGIPFASMGSMFLSAVFTFLSLVLLFAPGGAMILVGVAIGRLVVLLTSAIVIAVMTLGVFFIAMPTPLTQRLGEDMFSAGVMYFVTFPLLAPVSYAFYKYVVETTSRSITTSPISIPIGAVSLFIPLEQIINITIYITASGVVLLMVLISLSYILQRTGIALGLGEALSGLVWRG